MSKQIAPDSPLQALQGIINQPNFVHKLSQNLNENVTMVMGLTRSGKSTLVNYLIGNTLQVASDSDEEMYLKIKEASTSIESPVIGHGSLAETTTPTRCESSYNGTVWDLPGFGDNRGAVQDITNAYFIRSLINHTRSCKLLLVADFDNLKNSNVKLFTELLVRVHDLFPTITDHLSGVSIVFTKYQINHKNLRGQEEPSQSIANMLYKKIIDQPKMKIANDQATNDQLKALVQYFINNPNSISVFNRPGDYEEGKIWKIDPTTPLVSTLKGRDFIQTTALTGGFSLAPESREFLLGNYNTLKEMKGIKKLIQKIKGEYKNYFNKLQEDIKHKNFEKVENEISEFKQKFKETFKPLEEVKQISITGTLRELSEFSPECLNEVERSIIPSQENFIVFIQEILEKNNRDYLLPITQAIYVKVRQSFESIEKELKIIEIDLAVANHACSLEEAQELKKNVEQEAESKARELQELVTKFEDISKETVTYWKTCKETMIEGTKGACLPVTVQMGVTATALFSSAAVGAAVFAAPAVLVGGVLGSTVGGVRGMVKGYRNSHEKHLEIKNKKQELKGALEIKKEEKKQLELELSTAQSEVERRAQDFEQIKLNSQIEKQSLAHLSKDDSIWGDDDTDYIDPDYFSMQGGQTYKPEGRGLGTHEQNDLQLQDTKNSDGLEYPEESNYNDDIDPDHTSEQNKNDQEQANLDDENYTLLQLAQHEANYGEIQRLINEDPHMQIRFEELTESLAQIGPQLLQNNEDGAQVLGSSDEYDLSHS